METDIFLNQKEEDTVHIASFQGTCAFSKADKHCVVISSQFVCSIFIASQK